MNNREGIGAFPIPTPGVSLGVFSPQGRHNTTYTENMPMKEAHTVTQTACPGKFPYRPPQQGQGPAPTFHLTGYLVGWY